MTRPPCESGPTAGNGRATAAHPALNVSPPSACSGRMDWREQLLDRLADCVPCGYERGGPTATEPTALASMALVAAGRTEAAEKGLAWLAEMQQTDGSLGPAEGLSSPGWPTSLAILADAIAHGSDSGERDGSIGFVALTILPLVRKSKFDRQRGVEWLLATRGTTLERGERGGHDPMLVGWPWAEGTHSWVEPTALAVLALKAVGLGDHDRTREAVRLLHDRLFSDGGCNYGNTVVLGQELRPHLQPTAIALLALWQRGRPRRTNCAVDRVSRGGPFDRTRRRRRCVTALLH